MATRMKRTIFALDLRKSDVILDVNDDDDIHIPEGGLRIEYVGDWCRGPDNEFGARIGFSDGTHVTLIPTDVLVVGRR